MAGQDRRHVGARSVGLNLACSQSNVLMKLGGSAARAKFLCAMCSFSSQIEQTQLLLAYFEPCAISRCDHARLPHSPTNSH